jgi:hypothetical protein
MGLPVSLACAAQHFRSPHTPANATRLILRSATEEPDHRDHRLLRSRCQPPHQRRPTRSAMNSRRFIDRIASAAQPETPRAAQPETPRQNTSWRGQVRRRCAAGFQSRLRQLGVKPRPRVNHHYCQLRPAADMPRLRHRNGGAYADASGVDRPYGRTCAPGPREPRALSTCRRFRGRITLRGRERPRGLVD